ncbi:zf-TFIIB domain-containing protein [Thermodesulfobacteriota bacterium]
MVQKDNKGASIDKEEEYFYKLDKELLEKKRKELDAQRAEQATKERKEQHWMKCPKCGADLEEICYQDVMIDKCTECEGIWLDQGELELLVEGKAIFSKSFLISVFGGK